MLFIVIFFRFRMFSIMFLWWVGRMVSDFVMMVCSFLWLRRLVLIDLVLIFIICKRLLFMVFIS